MSWTESALCYEATDPDQWFPDPTDERALAEAQAVCAVCPVAQACFDAAYDAREKAGVWGGVLFGINSHASRNVRAALRNKRRKFVESVESAPLSVHTLRRKKWVADRAQREAEQRRQADSRSTSMSSPTALELEVLHDDLAATKAGMNRERRPALRGRRFPDRREWDVSRCPECGDWRWERMCGTCVAHAEQRASRARAHLALMQSINQRRSA